MEIRRSKESEKTEIDKIHKIAFGEEAGPEIAKLVSDLFNDKTAEPLLSLVAVQDERLVGHVLFTKVSITQTKVTARILAPLAVIPEAQNMGVGGLLIKEGLEILKKAGVDLVFVLGHPGYYPRSGFFPAGSSGFEAPYPILEKDADAWMVIELSSGVIGAVKGRVECSDELNHPQFWVE